MLIADGARVIPLFQIITSSLSLLPLQPIHPNNPLLFSTFFHAPLRAIDCHRTFFSTLINNKPAVALPFSSSKFTRRYPCCRRSRRMHAQAARSSCITFASSTLNLWTSSVRPREQNYIQLLRKHALGSKSRSRGGK